MTLAVSFCGWPMPGGEKPLLQAPESFYHVCRLDFAKYSFCLSCMNYVFFFYFNLLI